MSDTCQGKGILEGTGLCCRSNPERQAWVLGQDQLHSWEPGGGEQEIWSQGGRLLFPGPTDWLCECRAMAHLRCVPMFPLEGGFGLQAGMSGNCCERGRGSWRAGSSSWVGGAMNFMLSMCDWLFCSSPSVPRRALRSKSNEIPSNTEPLNHWGPTPPPPLPHPPSRLAGWQFYTLLPPLPDSHCSIPQ